MTLTKQNIYGPHCYHCGHTRSEGEAGVRHRCPKCGQSYLQSKAIQQKKLEQYAEERESSNLRSGMVFTSLFSFFQAFFVLNNGFFYTFSSRRSILTEHEVLWYFLSLILLSLALYFLSFDKRKLVGFRRFHRSFGVVFSLFSLFCFAKAVVRF